MASDIDSVDMESYVLPITRLVGELEPINVLEIGIGYDAYSTQIFTRYGDVNLTTVDKRDWGGWGQKMSGWFPDRYEFILGRSEEVLPTLKGPYDLIYVDGDHSYEGCYTDIINSMRLVTDGVILIDDYGVERSALDIDDEKGTIIQGDFGVKNATDDAFGEGWEECYQHLNFGNGAKAFRRKRET